MRHTLRLTILAASIAGPVSIAAQPPGDLETVLARVGEKIAEYYKRAQNVICTEKFTVQPISWNSTVDGFPRTTESELRVETDTEDGDGEPEAKVVRVIRKINGRPPREKDTKDRAGCTDPNPLSPEPLSFLLPAHRSDYAFALAGPGKGKDRDSLLIEFKSTVSGQRLELIESRNGIDDCYEGKGTIPTRGRVWINANSYDVIRIEEHLVAPVDFFVSDKLRRRHNLGDLMVIERADLSIRFKKVVFRDPDEELLLPEAIDDLKIFRGGLQSTRRSQVFSEYRRFLTEAKLVK